MWKCTNLLIFILFIGPIISYAQHNDTVQIGYSSISSKEVIYPSDTVLGIDDYFILKDFHTDDFYRISMGNQGDVRRRLNLISTNSFAPDLGIDGYFKNHNPIDHVPFYNVKVPLGGMRFLTGYDNGQMFGAYFTVNPISRLNIFIDYQRISARGNYFNQDNTSDRLQASSYFSTKNNFYRVFGAVSWNKDRALENGGILFPEQFEENEFGSNKELLPVRLSNSANKAASIDLLINQDYLLGKIDSNSSFRAFYQFEFKSKNQVFRSSDSAFISSAVFENEEVIDSIRLYSLNNFIGVLFENSKVELKAGLVGSYYKYGNEYFKQTDNLLAAKLEGKGKILEFTYNVAAQLHLINEYAGTYEVKLDANSRLKKNPKFKFGLSASTSKYLPGRFQNIYIGNNFIWNNQFSPISETQVDGFLGFENYKLTAGTKFLQNFIYFNQKALPSQYGELINYSFAELQARFKLVGNLFLDNRILFQTNTNNDILRLPDWRLRNILYYKLYLFNNALHTQFGLEFNYFSSFASNAYMPATTVMYLQDDVQIGDFPYFNFFVNFKIEELVFYVRAENITQGLFGYNYYAAPNYPLPDFALRIGATWQFFN